MLSLLLYLTHPHSVSVMGEYYVPHDQLLKTLFIAPITDSKHLLISDGQKFPQWLEFLELRNFYINLIVFDVVIMLQNEAVHHCCISHHKPSKLERAALFFDLNVTKGTQIRCNEVPEFFFSTIDVGLYRLVHLLYTILCYVMRDIESTMAYL